MEEWIPLPPPPVPPPCPTPCSLCSTPCSSGLVSSLGEDKVKRQSSVIFLVQKLLKIPLPECQELLRNYGDPEEWMDLCPICTSLLNEALDLNDEINRMRRKIEELGEKLALPLHIKLEEGEEEMGILPTPSSSTAARYIRRIVFNRGVFQRQCQPSTPLGNNEDNDDDNEVIIAPIAIGPLLKTDSASDFTEEEERNLSGLEHFLPLSPFHNFIAEVEGEEDSESDNSKDEDYVFPEVTTKIESESEEEEKKELKVTSSSSSVPGPRRKKKKGTRNRRLTRRKGDTRRRAAAVEAARTRAIKEEINDSASTTVKSDPDSIIHRRRPKGSRTFECSKDGCSQKFNTHEECVLHKNREHAVGFACEKCGKIVGSFTSLENHVRKRHYDKEEKKTIFACPGCGECWLGDIMEFQQHLGKADCKIECKEKTIPCSQCLWRFENQTTLDLHMKIKHLTTYAPIVCPHPQCGRSFKTMTVAYYTHVKSHKEDISQICDLCGKRCASLYFLRKHVADIHSNFDYKCDQCGQTFKCKKHLRRHKKLHTDVFPHLCTVCGKRFRMTNQLTVHMWSHDPDRKEKYSTYKPKPKGYKPMREKRKRFRPTGGPPEEMQGKQSSINKFTDSSTSTSTTDPSIHESFITNPNSMNPHPRMFLPGFLPIPIVGTAQPQDTRMMDLFGYS